MKLITTLTLAFIAAVSFGASASASNYTVTSNASLFDAVGSLDGNSQITFTYTSNGASPGIFLTAVGDETVGGTASATSFSFGPQSNNSSTIHVPSGILTVLTAAGIGGTTFVTIENLTNVVATFNALIAAPFLGQAGTITTFGPSAVPLPASVVLFATSLLMLAGFAALRRVRSKI